MMANIDWEHAARIAVWSILIALATWGYLALAVRAGRKLHEMSEGYEHEEEERLLDDARRKRRSATLLAIAEEINAMPEHEQQRIQRQAEMLGFMDENDRKDGWAA